MVTDTTCLQLVLTIKADGFLLYIQSKRATPIHNLLILQLLQRGTRQTRKRHSSGSMPRLVSLTGDTNGAMGQN